LRVWLIATVANLRPLPLLAALGSKGSGKTTLARSVARLFLGPDADVVPLSDDARDFDTSATTKPIHALDNVDASETPPWFADRLATVVTGGAVERRALFTNAGVYRAPVTAALVVTSRTAAYARPDVAERTLPLLTVEFERDEERKADADLAGMVEAARDACLTWLAVNAAELLRHLRHAPEGLPLRFVDFARLVWADAQADGQEEEARPRLLALRQAQATLVGEGNPLLEAILAMPADEEAGRPWLHGTATDIVRELQNATTVEMPHYGGGKALARHLRELAGILRTFGWRFEERPQSGGHTLFNLQGPATRRPER
jgi:energy-coupling factor transporter ATP-binding protein EcfA2